jgi:hypothetical protein
VICATWAMPLGFLDRVGDEASRGRGGCYGCSATGCHYLLKPFENEPANSTPPPVFLRHSSGAVCRHSKSKAGNESQSWKSSANDQRGGKASAPLPGPFAKRGIMCGNAPKNRRLRERRNVRRFVTHCGAPPKFLVKQGNDRPKNAIQCAFFYLAL